MRLPPQPLTDDQRQRACALLAAGATRTSAAKFVGCRRGDLDAEIKRDPGFRQLIRQSELRPELESLRILRDAARDPKQWRAAAWTLERLYPRRYGTRKRNTLTKADEQRFLQWLEQDPKLVLPPRQKRSARKKRRAGLKRSSTSRR